MADAGTWVQSGSAIFAVVIGAVLARTISTQTHAKIHEKRLTAYASLWALLAKLGMTTEPLNEDEREDLSVKLTRWYYGSDGGMFLTAPTQKMCLCLRDNLARGGIFKPDRWRLELLAPKPDDERYSTLLRRQGSLLRTQLKVDCSIYLGAHVSPGQIFAPFDTEFLSTTVTNPELNARGGSMRRYWAYLLFRARLNDDPILTARKVWGTFERDAKSVLRAQYLEEIG